MSFEIYEAFRSIDVPEDKALKAANAISSALSGRDGEVAASFGKRDTDILGIKTDISSIRIELATVKGDVALLKWMVGFVLAFVVAMTFKLFAH